MPDRRGAAADRGRCGSAHWRGALPAPRRRSQRLRGAIRQLDRALPVFEARRVRDQLDVVIMPQRFGLTLLAVFGVVALVVSAVGIYGVVAFSVEQRRSRRPAVTSSHRERLTIPEEEEDEGVVDLMALLKERMEKGARPARARTAAAGLEDATKEELYERAKDLGVEGRSSMSRSQLIRAIRAA